jgi:hypothetical protein
MSQIVEPKTYEGKELETIFFRPMLSGTNATELGIRVLYNMPVPTILGFWRGASNVLRAYSAGWSGGNASTKFQKTIDLKKVKSEMGYSAADYSSMVYEQIAAEGEVNFNDLSGTQLEEAETRLFREALAESLRATMWIGSVDRESALYNTFNGFFSQLMTDMNADDPQVNRVAISSTEYDATDAGEALLKKVWNSASLQLKELKNEGNLVFFVTSDIYSKYEESLDSATLEAAYIARQQGRPSLSYRGIPVVDMQVSGYLEELSDLPSTWVILADKRNLTLAVNTSDFPGTEVRMWYNPDEMQNRQRAVFAAGCDYLLPELICYGFKS